VEQETSAFGLCWWY